MSVEIKPTGTETGWNNVFRMGLGGDISVYGDRNPAIWFDGDSTKLHIASAVNGNKNFVTNTNPIPLNEWTKVDISQTRQPDGSYKFTISVGGDTIREITNNDPREFKDIKVSPCSEH